MDDDLLARADDLNHRIEEQAPSINDLMAYSAKSRRLTLIGLVLSVVLAVMLVAIALVTLQVRDNALHLARVDDVAKAVAENLRRTCEDANADKAKEAELWQQIFDFPPSPDQTPAQKSRAAAIEVFVRSVYAPDDCSVVAP